MLDVLGVVAAFAPFLIILWLANLGQKLREQEIPHMSPVIVSYGLLVILYLLLILLGFGAMLVRVVLERQPELAAQFPGMEVNLPEQTTSWAWLTWGMILPAVLGLVLLLKPVRRAAARVIAIDPEHPVHAVALSLSMMSIILLALALGVGLGAMSAQLAQQVEETGRPAVSLGALWAQAFIFLLMALIGVGWLSRRSFGQVLVRLGIVKPTLREVFIGIGAAVVLAPGVMLFEAAASAVGLGVAQDVESLTEELIGPLFASPLGILSIGLAAAIGEEPIFRGALQPRFGLFLSALLFALVHSQYGFSLATLIVFGLGLVLGLIRQRYNTMTAIITHALYNSLLGVFAYFAAQFLLQQS